MQSVDIVELEGHVHRWASQISVAAGRQKWAYPVNNVHHFGLTLDLRKSMAQTLTEIILQDSDILVSSKIQAMEEMINHFAADIVLNDFPTKCVKKSNERNTIVKVEVLNHIRSMYAMEIEVRQSISNMVSEQVTNSSKSQHKM